MTTEQEQALQLATEAGHILLENGAEISRVEETMTRIASAYGIEDESFFVLSNGIIATGQHYARAEFIPIKGTQLAKVVEVNQLSRDVTAGECGNELTCECGNQTNEFTNPQVNTFKPMSVETLRQRIQAIRTMPGKVWWEMTLGIALGVSSFSILFGGSLVDAVATLVAGVLLGLFMTFVSPHLSRLVGNVAGGLVGGILCILLFRLAMGIDGLPQLHLANMIIGTIIALVPGVPFTNGMRDLANEDYIAGTTRRTGDDVQDVKNANYLRNDPKENAEHVMLVDLARNDLSRNCHHVKVEFYKELQYYSHVIHLVSRVSGILNRDADPIKTFIDTFPAGTLSGAPKVRAMQLISEYEPHNRGAYGGCVGSISFDGSLNQAITIRTFVSRNNELWFQAGGGIVAKSNEEYELQEVNNKLGALRRAILLAQDL